MYEKKQLSLLLFYWSGYPNILAGEMYRIRLRDTDEMFAHICSYMLEIPVPQENIAKEIYIEALNAYIPGLSSNDLKDIAQIGGKNHNAIKSIHSKVFVFGKTRSIYSDGQFKYVRLFKKESNNHLINFKRQTIIVYGKHKYIKINNGQVAGTKLQLIILLHFIHKENIVSIYAILCDDMLHLKLNFSINISKYLVCEIQHNNTKNIQHKLIISCNSMDDRILYLDEEDARRLNEFYSKSIICGITNK